MHLILVAVGCLACVPPDTTRILASRSVDLTGDGEAEVLEILGVLVSPDSLEVTFVIRMADRLLYEASLAPLTRTVGFDGTRRRLSAEEYQEQVDSYGEWFLGDSKFNAATAFERALQSAAPGRVTAIPEVIARDSRGSLDMSKAAAVWAAIKQRGGVVFEYSPGGDRIVAIAWSRKDERFYRLVECC